MGNRTEFGAIAGDGGALGLQGGNEVIVECAEDGGVVGGVFWRDAALEEWRG